MEKKGKVFSGSGYKYKNNNGEDFIEFHVDDHPLLFATMTEHVPYGGYLSVRKNDSDKPLLIFCQDECIFKQYTFRSKCWNGPSGEVPLMPKDKGQGLMISAFVSGEFGFNWQLSQEQLIQVNHCRKNNFFSDTEAAITKHGKTEKYPLTHSPFQQQLQYGAMREGYWTYKDMVLQLEDCVDCLKCLLGNDFDYLFLFDHSNSHDRVAADALNPATISKSFGGK